MTLKRIQQSQSFRTKTDNKKIEKLLRSKIGTECNYFGKAVVSSYKFEMTRSPTEPKDGSSKHKDS